MSLNTEFALYHHVIVNVRLTVLFNTFMTHTLHVYSAKEKKKDRRNRIKCPPTNVSLSAVRALNVTKAGCSGTTGTVRSMSRTIKQSEQVRVRLQLFHTTGNELLQSEFFPNSQLCSRVTDSTVVLAHPSSLCCNVTNWLLRLKVHVCVCLTYVPRFRMT